MSAVPSNRGAEPPLAEDAERYEVAILDGAAVKRAMTSAAPSAVYSATDQIADFGTLRSTVTVRVAQLGALGRGTYRDAVL